MNIQTVQDARLGGYIVNGHLNVPDNADNRLYKAVQKWIADGNTPDAADPAPAPPTTDEIYTEAIRSQRFLKALVLCLNDGSIVPGANVPPGQLRSAIKAKL